MVVHWPGGITDQGGLRTQFTHVIDIGPTILDVAGIPAPTQRRRDRADADARHQLRLHASTDGDAPERHTQQYFEIVGNRAMYKDGWLAVVDAAADPVGRSPRRR